MLHRFGSLRSLVTKFHHRFAAPVRPPPVNCHHRFNVFSPFSGSLLLAAREYLLHFRLAPPAGHERSLPFRGSLPLAAREFDLPFRLDPQSQFTGLLPLAARIHPSLYNRSTSRLVMFITV